MTNVISNPCTRCGKQRIAAGTTYEKTNGATIKITVNVCPDPECQKKVDEKLDMERKRREELTVNKENKLNQRRGIKLGSKHASH